MRRHEGGRVGAPRAAQGAGGPTPAPSDRPAASPRAPAPFAGVLSCAFLVSAARAELGKAAQQLARLQAPPPGQRPAQHRGGTAAPLPPPSPRPAPQVFFMQCGFALLEAGTVRIKNTKNIRESWPWPWRVGPARGWGAHPPLPGAGRHAPAAVRRTSHPAHPALRCLRAAQCSRT